MPLTSIEIKQQTFAKAMRGCDPAEVKAFLDLVSGEWEHLSHKNKELAQRVEDLQEKLDHYKKVEKDLHETLKNARETIQTKMDSAEQQAKHSIERAEIQAETIVREAKEEREQMYAHVLQLHNRRREIVGSIRSYLKASIDSLDHFDDEQTQRFAPPEEPLSEAGQDSKKQPVHSEPSLKMHSSPNDDSIDELIDDLD